MSAAVPSPYTDLPQVNLPPAPSELDIPDIVLGPRPPDHTQLPDSDGKPVENFLEHPQSILLTDVIVPILRRRHPDGQFAIGQNSGIYWRITNPPLDGCKAPDWYYVPGVPSRPVEGVMRRSYVLWYELIAPLILLEFASGDGSEERDQTPRSGKFWVYEKVIRSPYYGIFVVATGQLEVYRLVDGIYERMQPNEQGLYPIAALGVQAVWTGFFLDTTTAWMRWFDEQGNLLPTHEEIAEQEKQRAEQEKQRAEQEHERAERLTARLRSLGIDPESE